MKKMFKYASLSAIAFVGAVSFSACSSSDDVVENNPNVNPDKATVKTAITMNIGRGGQTRMASAVTQMNNQPFRGMFNVYIYPASVYDNTAWAPITGSSTINDPVVVSSTIEAITADQSNKTYSNVQVPINTNNFLFYGRAGSTAPASVEDKLAKGFTVPTFPTASPTIAGISFAAQQIVDPTAATWTGPVTILTNYLNSIKTAIGDNPLSNASFEALRLDFLKPSTPRAGSAEAVLATVQHMYTTINGYTGLNEADAAIRTAVNTAITTAPGKLNSTTIEWATEGSSVLSETTFPANLGLPLGAAQYQYNTTNSAFEYVTDATPSVANTPVADFIYPSELFYFTNTPLKGTSANVTWAHTPGTWQTVDYEGWTDAVQASSKNIALVNNVQYGTALLATQVKCTPSDGKLYDNSKEKDPTSEVNIAVPYAANMFPLTGVLVGTQPSTVGWNFLPSGGLGTFTKCIYDRNVSWYAANEESENKEKTIYANNTGENYSNPNYTLVYDNSGYQNASSENFVNICLEFTNNSGVDFYGKDGLIKNGQKFYLVGKLDPNTTSGNSTGDLSFPSAVGNQNATYYPSIERRVFIQDFTTTAQCNISAGSATTKGSLANALSSIPDMKAVTQTIGLSVDLAWTPGLTYVVPLGQ